MISSPVSAFCTLRIGEVPVVSLDVDNSAYATLIGVSPSSATPTIVSPFAHGL